jgi:hypothetical protein
VKFPGDMKASATVPDGPRATPFEPMPVALPMTSPAPDAVIPGAVVVQKNDPGVQLKKLLNTVSACAVPSPQITDTINPAISFLYVGIIVFMLPS